MGTSNNGIRDGVRRALARLVVLAVVLNVLAPLVALAEVRTQPIAVAGLYDESAICHSGAAQDQPGETGHHGQRLVCPMCLLLGHQGAFAPTAEVVVRRPEFAHAQYPLPPPDRAVHRRLGHSLLFPRAPPAL